MALISPIELDVKNKAIQSEDRATHLSIYSMIGGVVASISNVVVGKVADFSIQYGFALCAGMSLLALFFLMLYAKKNLLNVWSIQRRIG